VLHHLHSYIPDQIDPILSRNNHIYCQKHICVQVLLELAWAMIVHKSQGLTLEVTKIGLGKSEFCIGLTFVVLSHVKASDGDCRLLKGLESSVRLWMG
jgi:hypothetical protein